MKTKEPPYTERYVRWCGRSVDKIIIYLLPDYILIVGKREERAETQRLEKVAEQDKAEAKKALQKTEDDTEAEDETGTESDVEAEETSVSDETAAAEGIVCWGDDLINGDASATYSYMAVLQKLLQENGYNLPVINKTLQGGGTLSMMKMAGVDDATLQNYITSHQQAANGAQLNVTETGIRDLTAEQTERNDLNCIPVIFMGYYGGWNHDVNELAEQQQKILETFPNQDKFIVVGTRPVDGRVDTTTLDTALQAKWGEHYISLDTTSPNPSSTYEAQSAMAAAILQKMEDLNYITK